MPPRPCPPHLALRPARRARSRLSFLFSSPQPEAPADMGLCFSKKKKPPPGGAGATSSKKKPGKVAAAAVADDKAKKTAQQPKGAAAPDKSAVKAKAAVTPGGEEKRKKRAPQEEAAKQLPVVVIPSTPVRTSSCTREEVDAILIQCGRLSRSSSGTGRAASGDTGGDGGSHRRRRSGSKRSYDFDHERKAGAVPGGDEEGDWESRPVSRPSPHRGSPQRKRSGSRERSSGGGSRRASRSPGRRGESAAMAGSGGGERARQQQQPGKMVSVPAREKGRAPSPAPASGIRCASPRSSSPARMAVGNENICGAPATGPTPLLSRSSSRTAEQSPYRRNPMAELDENILGNNNSSNNNGKPQKKSTENTVAAVHQKTTDRGKEPGGTASCRSAKEKPEVAEGATVAASDTRALSAKTNVTRTASVVAESPSKRPAAGCRSRRASRDFDQSSNSYASQILEDIQNYHEQHQAVSSAGVAPATPSFTLPACVAKACSILEAVADLNSSSSDNRTYDYEPGRSADDKGSVNALSGTDSRVEPSARRHLPAVRDIRAETEPQESAGSNSVSGIPLTPSWEPGSVESTDRTWSTGDEVVNQACSHGAPSPMIRPRQSKQRPSQPEPSGRSRAGSGNGNSLHRGRGSGSGSVASGRSGVRAVSAAS